MEDFYKKKYEETQEKLRRVERELDFYKRLCWSISGMTTASLYLIFLAGAGIFSKFLVENWVNFSISDKLALGGVIITTGGVIIRYSPKIFNWPEELYFYNLKKEKEARELKNNL